MVCFDTSFIVDFLRGKNETGELLKKLRMRDESLFVTPVTIMELSKGAWLSNNPKEESSKVKNVVSSFQILKFDIEEAFLAGEIESSLIKKGQKTDVEDIMISSIALQNKETLVTRNVKHFEKIDGLKIESY